MSTQRKLGCGIAGALVVLALLFGVAAYQFKQYEATLEGLPGKATPIMIAITDPHTGQTVPAGTPLLVHVSAGAPEALLSLELWVNGQIVGIQAAPSSNGITPFAADFAWTPADPGTYTLIARGLQAGDQSADSAGVVVIVGPTEKTADEGGGGDTGQSIPISNGGGGDGGSIPLPPPPEPPDASDSIGPGQPWNLSLGDWLSAELGGTPEAPEVTAVAEGCGAVLSIHDLSQNEDGFIVFRMTETAPTLSKIVTLEGQSELEWLTFTDESYTHENSYLVRAFNGVEVTDSNIVYVEGDPADCAQNPSAPLFSIKLTGLKTDVGVEMAYCYKSLNGMDWSRWPAAGFFLPGADGFDVQSQADVLLLNELDGKVLTLDLECWGWVGGALQLLGQLHHAGLDPGLLGVTQLIDGGLIVGLELGGYMPLNDPMGDDPPVYSGPDIVDPKMPKVDAWISLGPETCALHLPSEGDNLLENLLFCAWFPEYNTDQGASQPYLLWATTTSATSDTVYNGKCLNGEGPDCNNFQYYVNRAKVFGGQVGFHVYPYEYDVSTGASFHLPIDTTPHDRTQYVVPPIGTCGTGESVLHFIVRMFYQGGPNDPDYANLMVESPDSNLVEWALDCPAPSEVKLRVIFDTLEIGNLDDGEGGGDDLEIYASMVAHGQNPGTGSALNLGYWGWSGADCEDDAVEYGLQFNPGGAECPANVGEGDIPMNALSLCASNTYKHCVGPYGQTNNVIDITVADGSQIRVAIHAMDYDDIGDDDNVCQTEKIIGPKSIAEWQGFTTSTSMSQGDNGSASCKVHFQIVPAP